MLNMYINTSDNRYLNKSLTTLASDVPCEFKEDTSLEQPTVIISPDVYNASCNYVYITDTGRYYYIEDITYSQQRIYMHLKCDVLMSFRSALLNCEAVAGRSANQYNNYLDDEHMERLAYSDIYLKKFPNSFNKNLTLILVIGGA